MHGAPDQTASAGSGRRATYTRVHEQWEYRVRVVALTTPRGSILRCSPLHWPARRDAPGLVTARLQMKRVGGRLGRLA